MGGELQESGSYDGPFSENDDTLVSIRCNDHFQDGHRSGHVLMRRSPGGNVYEPAERPRPRMAMIRGKVRR